MISDKYQVPLWNLKSIFSKINFSGKFKPMIFYFVSRGRFFIELVKAHQKAQTCYQPSAMVNLPNSNDAHSRIKVEFHSSKVATIPGGLFAS
jgi:hypothetical protein